MACVLRSPMKMNFKQSCCKSVVVVVEVVVVVVVVVVEVVEVVDDVEVVVEVVSILKIYFKYHDSVIGFTVKTPGSMNTSNQS